MITSRRTSAALSATVALGALSGVAVAVITSTTGASSAAPLKPEAGNTWSVQAAGNTWSVKPEMGNTWSVQAAGNTWSVKPEMGNTWSVAPTALQT